MSFNISNLLEKMGLSAQKRAIYLQFNQDILNQQIFLQYIEGQHQLNVGLQAKLICFSGSMYIPLKQLLGTHVAVDQVTDTGQLFRTTGIITEAQYGQNDGALTLYQLTLHDATYLWQKRRNSRVFINKNIIDVTQVLFREWQERSSLFAASLSLDLSGLNQSYDIRPFIMQHNESDYDFLTRLWRSEGINWLIDESQLFVSHTISAIQAQKLRLIDDNNQYQALSRRHIRYHQSSAIEQQDSITRFQAVHCLQPNIVHVQRWQADELMQDDGAGSVISPHTYSAHFDLASLSLEQAWHMTPAWISDLKGEDQATLSGNMQLEKLNQQFQDQYAVQAKYFHAQSSVRDAQVGYWFRLIDHPEMNQHEQIDQEFLIIAKKFYNQNNLAQDLQQRIDHLLSHNNWRIQQQNQERQGNQLSLIRRHIKVVPDYDPIQHRPMIYPQRAKVVGPENESIYVDEWGRIKVRFLFTRPDDHAHDGGAGSNDNDTDSAWVDVLTPWAGEGYGARFLPRIGEMVVIDFFDGNLDRPFVMGRIHEAERSPTQFDVKGQLPETKKLSGIRSQEVNGCGFNQLRFDDTTGQISTQLQSSYAATQLNLGNLSHPKQQEKSDGRGEGFELRTDAWGAVRAGKGMLISTYAQEQAVADHLEAAQAHSLLSDGYKQMKMLSEVATKQHTDTLNLMRYLSILNLDSHVDTQQSIPSKIFKQALMLLASPNGIALTTPEAIILQASQDIVESANASINLSAQQDIIGHAQDKISLFAAQKGLSAYAAKGKLELQAQDDAIEVIARKVIKLMSTENKIELTSPKEIVLTAGGSQLKINSSGIFTTTGGKFESRAGQHLFMGGAKVSYELVELPKMGVHAVDFLFSSLAGTAIENAKVQIYEPDKKEIIWEGITDSTGKSNLSVQEESKQYVALIGFAEWSSIFMDEDQYEEEPDEEFEIGEHSLQFENNNLKQ